MTDKTRESVHYITFDPATNEIIGEGTTQRACLEELIAKGAPMMESSSPIDMQAQHELPLEPAP